MKKTIGYISANYTRESFGELTARRTLASLPFAGRYRLIDFVLSNMVNSGISTVGLVSPFNARSLLDHVGVGKPWDLGRKVGGLFVLSGTLYGMRRGSGKLLMRDLAENSRFLHHDDAENVLICGSNKVYNMDYRPLIEAHEASGSPVTFAYTNITIQSEREGIFLEIDDKGQVSGSQSKATGEINLFMDCMVINRQFLIKCIEWYKALEHMSLTDILLQNLQDIQINTYSFDGYVGLVDSVSDFMKVNMDVLDSKIAGELFNPDRRISTQIQDCPPTLYKTGSCVKNSLVAAGCIIEGAVENSIISREVTIKPGAVVKNCILMDGCVIEEGAHINNVICDKNANVRKDVQMSGGIKPLVLGKDRLF